MRRFLGILSFGLIALFANATYATNYSISYVYNDPKFTGYSYVSYIRGTGTQYINTGYNPTATTRTEIDLRFSSDTYKSSGGNTIFGVTGTSDSYYVNFGNDSNQGLIIFPWTCKYQVNGCAANNFSIASNLKTSKQTLVLDAKNKIALYGSTTKSLTQTPVVPTNAPIYLFALNHADNNSATIYARNNSMDVYGTRIIENGTLRHNFVPMMRNSDGVCGLYDMIDQEFFPSETSTDFICGDALDGFPTSYISGNGVHITGQPTRAGYAFAGWCTDSALTDCAMTQTISTSATGNKVFYAKWAQLNDVGYVLGYGNHTTPEYLYSGDVVPSDYSPTAYIQNISSTRNDTNTIDLGFTGYGRWLIDAQGMTAPSGYNSVLFGYNTSSPIGWFGANPDGFWAAPNVLVFSTLFTTRTTIDATYSSGSATITIGDQTKTQTLSALSQGTWRFFNYEGNNPTLAKMFSAKFYQNNELKFNGIPVRRNSDNVCGIYDTVSKAFFTSSAKTNFVCPESRTPDQYASGIAKTITYIPQSENQNLEFAGWCTDATLTDCSMNPTIPTNATGPQIFYAKWSSGVITYVTNGGSVYNTSVVPTADYTPVEYLQSNSYSYINTGITGLNSGTWEIYIKWMMTNVPRTTNAWIVGEYYNNGNTSSYRVAAMNKRTDYYYIDAGNRYNQAKGITLYPNKIHEVTLKNRSFVADGVTTSASTDSANAISASTPIMIFASTSSGGDAGVYGRLYASWAKKGGVLQYNYVPVRRNSDGVCGMYDTVTATFKPSSNGINFSCPNTAVSTPATYTYGVATTISGGATNLHGTLDGWCTDAALTNCAASQTIPANSTENQTFYAKWICDDGYHMDSVTHECVPNTITMTFANGGHGTAPASMTCTYGSSVTLPAAIDDATGYNFRGWKINGKWFTANTAYICSYENFGVYDTTANFVADWYECMDPGDGSCVDTKFSVTTTPLGADTTFSFKIGAKGTFYIDWGDGSQVETITRTGTTPTLYSHVYNENGDAEDDPVSYTVRFGGVATGYATVAKGANTDARLAASAINFYSGTPALVKNISGSLGKLFPTISNSATDGQQPRFYYTFLNCTNLESIPAGLFNGVYGAPHRYMFQSTFNGCSKITSIPEDLFATLYGTINTDHVAVFVGTFANMPALTTIPAGLFRTITSDPVESLFYQTFYNDTGLTSIPADLFNSISGAPAASMFYQTFYGCTGLTSIPGTLFSNIRGAPAGSMFAGTFQGCTGLTGPIPANLFSGISGASTANMFENTFNGCSNLSGYVPTSLFKNITSSAATNIMKDIFVGTNLDTTCPTGTSQYTTGFESWWSGKVACGPEVDTSNLGNEKFTITTTNLAANTTFKFSLSAAGTFAVDWGDGITEEIVRSGVAANTYQHTYTTAGSYQIKFYGTGTAYATSATVPAIGFFNGTRANQSSAITARGTEQYIAGISGSLGALFPTIGDGVASGTQPRFYQTFAGAINMTSSIPETLFSGITGKPASYMFDNTFYGCTGLTGSIPATLFSGLSGTPADYLFYYTFYGCAGLTGSIPATLFSGVQGAPGAQMFANTFYGCTGLSGSIPATLFSSIRGAPTNYLFAGTFEGCTGLTGSIPEDLFSGISGATADYMFSQTFMGCTGLTGSIPAGLFRNITGNSNTSTGMFYRTFKGCSGLTGSVPSRLFRYSTGFRRSYVFYETFNGCSGLTGYIPYDVWPLDPTGQLNWSTLSNTSDFYTNMFAGATSLATECPTGMLRYNAGIDSSISPYVMCIDPSNWGDAKFTVTTTEMAANTTFSVTFAFAGTIYIDWGDGSGSRYYYATSNTSFSAYTMSHKYTTAGSYQIKFYGAGTKYRSNGYAISFKNNTNVAGISGNLGALLPAANGTTPWFQEVFSGCTSLTGTIPDYLFGNPASSSAPNKFNAAFQGCTALNTFIPPTLFKGYSGTYSNQFTNVFADSAVLTECPTGYVQYTTGLESYFSGRVACVPERTAVELGDAKFTVTTTELAADTIFSFKLSAAGTFYVDWGDGSDIQTISDARTTERTYSHTYANAGSYQIKFWGEATAYSTTDMVAAIRFFTGSYNNNSTFNSITTRGSEQYIAGISGSLGALFPTIGTGAVNGQQPRFTETFSGAINLTSSIPVNLFNGIVGKPVSNMFFLLFDACTNLSGTIPAHMLGNLSGAPAENAFNGIFRNCSSLTGTIPADMFSGVSGAPQNYTFANIFSGCTGLSGSIPATLFSGVTGAVKEGAFENTFGGCTGLSGYVSPTLFAGITGTATKFMNNVFVNSGLSTTCPDNMVQYITGLESYWSSKVACVEPFITPVVLNYGTATTAGVPAAVYLKYGTGFYSDSNATTQFTQMSTLPAQSGMGFNGYWTGDAGTGTQVIDANGNIISNATTLRLAKLGDESITLYADMPDRYTVTYNCGEGTGTAPANDYILDGHSFTPAGSTCSRDGYVFKGWAVSGTNDIVFGAFTWNYNESKAFMAQWTEEKFAVTTTNLSANTAFSFKLSAAGTFYVDWGDGTMQKITRTNTTETTYTHTYENAGTYQIKFGGVATGYSTDSSSAVINFSGNTKIAEISGSLGALFPTILPATTNGNQPRFTNTFSNCTNLTGTIPATLFSGISGAPVTGMFNSTFYGCTGLTGSIPATLFSGLSGTPADYLFSYTFYGCTGLTGSIPATLFSGISGTPAQGMFQGTFSNCTGLSGSIPATLFSGISGTPASHMFRETFTGCSGLSDSIPATLFSGISGAAAEYMFKETFRGCTGLTSYISPKLFARITGTADSMMDRIFNNTGLATSCGNYAKMQYITGFESSWDSKVSCGDFVTPIDLNNENADTGSDPTRIYLRWGLRFTTDEHANLQDFLRMTTLPTKSGKRFNGYWTGENATGTKIIDANGELINTAENKKITKVTDETFTLYAGFSDSYNVTYSCGDGTGDAPAADIAAEHFSFTPAENTCVRDGYSFNGWAISGTNTVVSDTFEWTYTEDKTLTAQWREGKFIITTTNLSSNSTFSFKLSAKGTFTVDWGDGSAVQTITRDSTSVGTYSRKYTSAGVRTIIFNGVATGYSTNSAAISFSGNTYIAGILGSLGALFPTISPASTAGNQPRFNSTFYNCTNLAGTIPVNLFSGISGAPVQYMFGGTFYGCSKLTGSIPANLFSGISGTPANNMFYQTFYGCSKLTGSIPANLFSGISGAPASYMFQETFRGCTGLTSIPATLFSGISGTPADSMFYETFYGCTGLTGEIPATLFSRISGAPAGSMFYQTFKGCTGLSGSIPATLFSGISGAPGYSMFFETFYGCTGLSGSIPGNLFGGIYGPAATNMFYQTFRDCTGLSSYVPPQLFARITGSAASMMSNVFYNTGLATSCDDYDLTQYITGFESLWNSKVSCVEPYVTPITLNDMDATTSSAPGTIYVKYRDGFYSNVGATSVLAALSTLPTKTDRFFNGYWTATEGSGTQIIDANGDIISNDTTTQVAKINDESVTLYADWLINYNVTYNCGGGTGDAPTATTVLTREKFVPATNTCTKDGYFFAGWAVSNTDDVIREPSIQWKYTEDKTLTAQWIEDKFTVTTTNLSANDSFSFNMSAIGTFYVNWGDGNIQVITRNSTSNNTYSHTYTDAGTYQIKFGGIATGYLTSYAAISFSGNTKVAGISGSLGALFPTISPASTSGNQPRFSSTFYNCTNLAGTIPENLFSGISGQPISYMFSQTFFGCSNLTGSIPENLFGNLSGAPASYMFDSTFYNCSKLTGSIPANLFANLSGEWSYYGFYRMFYGCSRLSGYIYPQLFANIKNQSSQYRPMTDIFYNSGISTSCPSNMVQYLTGFESYWNGKVSCIEPKDVSDMGDAKFTVTTTNMPADSNFNFNLSAAGEFLVDCGNTITEIDEYIDKETGQMVTEEHTYPQTIYIARNTISNQTYSCYYEDAGVHQITFYGTGTGYSASYDNIAAISFANNSYLAGISGSLGALFPTISPASTMGNQPRFYQTFYNCTNLAGSIPENLFSGIWGYPTYRMFVSTFQSCSKLTGSIPENLFGNIAGNMDYETFTSTFGDCSGLSGYVPKSLFENITGNSYYMNGIFYHTNLLTKCPVGTKQYTTGFESRWNSKVACEPGISDDDAEFSVYIETPQPEKPENLEDEPISAVMSFTLSAAGTFWVDWGDGTVDKIERTNVTPTVYSHTYYWGGEHRINFIHESITGYSTNMITPAISFANNEYMYEFSGSLGALFPTVQVANTVQQPRFYQTFKGCTNLDMRIPEGLFSGIYGAPVSHMFEGLFQGCTGLVSRIPGDLFAGLSGAPTIGLFANTFNGCNRLDGYIPSGLFAGINGTPAISMFEGTFKGCSQLSDEIPEDLFSGIQGAPAERMFFETFDGCSSLSGYIYPQTFAGIARVNVQNMMTNIFNNSGLDTSCPSGTTIFLTGFEDYFGGKVSCKAQNWPDSTSLYILTDVLGVGDTVTFALSAVGTFSVDWGDGSSDLIERTNTTPTTYSHTYAGGDEYTIQIGSTNVTAYSTDETTAAISFENNTHIVGVFGALFRLMPILGNGNSNIPRFYRTFRNCTALESFNRELLSPGELAYPDGLTSTYVSHMFDGMFEGCTSLDMSKDGSGSPFIDPYLFDYLGGTPAAYTFANMFKGCTSLAGYIPPDLFKNAHMDGTASNLMTDIFANSGLDTTCPNDMSQFTTGFESSFSGKVSCMSAWDMPHISFQTIDLGPNESMTFSFKLSAKGTFMVDWGDGTTQEIDRNSTTETTYTHTYTNDSEKEDREYTITLYGTATEYSTSETTAAISFAGNENLALVWGTFSNVFPTIGNGTVAGQQPRFYQTFKDCVNMDNDGISFSTLRGAPVSHMFDGTFENTSLSWIDSYMFTNEWINDSGDQDVLVIDGGISGAPAAYVFANTFAGTRISDIPENLFWGLSGAPAAHMFENTFAGTPVTGVSSYLFTRPLYRYSDDSQIGVVGISGAPAAYMFAGTFADTRLYSLPDGIFDGISGAPAPYMYYGTFSGCGNHWSGLNDGFFGNISGAAAEGMFKETFTKNTGLGGYVPPYLFKNITGTATDMMTQIFHDTSLTEDCTKWDSALAQYITGFESWWEGKVACFDGGDMPWIQFGTVSVEPEESMTFSFKLSAKGNFVITWGDGTMQEITRTNTTETTYTHTYTNDDEKEDREYTITLYGTATEYSTSETTAAISFTGNEGLAWAWGVFGNVFPVIGNGTVAGQQPRYYQTFKNCVNMTYSGVFFRGDDRNTWHAAPVSHMFDGTFENTGITGVFSDMFSSDIYGDDIIGISGAPAPYMFANTFKSSALQSVSSDLFRGISGAPAAHMFENTFAGCEDLNMELDSNLFSGISGAPAEYMFAGTFAGCESLYNSIPENMFSGIDGAPAAHMFERTFAGCSLLGGEIPADLFSGVAGTAAADMFHETFAGCSGLYGSLPANLFIGITGSAAEMFAGTFDGCSNLSGYIPPTMFQNITGTATDMMTDIFANTNLVEDCAEYDSELTEYTTGFESYWDGKVSCVPDEIEELNNAKLYLSTTGLGIGDTFSFKLSAKGEFMVDWGDGTPIQVIIRNNTTETTYSHTYENEPAWCSDSGGGKKGGCEEGADYWLAFDGLATGYSTNETTAAISFANNPYIADTEGLALGRMFPTIGKGTLSGQQPRFYQTFKNCTNFKIDARRSVFGECNVSAGGIIVDEKKGVSDNCMGIFTGVFGQPVSHMFDATFEGTKIYGTLPLGLFIDIYGTPVPYVFANTFKGCTNLGLDENGDVLDSSALPSGLFAGLVGAPAAHMFESTFENCSNMRGSIPHLFNVAKYGLSSGSSISIGDISEVAARKSSVQRTTSVARNATGARGALNARGAVARNAINARGASAISRSPSVRGGAEEVVEEIVNVPGSSSISSSISADMFSGISGAPAAYMFSKTFKGCSNLTGGIPQTLFAGVAGAPAAYMFEETFAGCSGLESIPSCLFSGISGAPAEGMYSGTFDGCSNVVWEYNPTTNLSSGGSISSGDGPIKDVIKSATNRKIRGASIRGAMIKATERKASSLREAVMKGLTRGGSSISVRGVGDGDEEEYTITYAMPSLFGKFTGSAQPYMFANTFRDCAKLDGFIPPLMFDGITGVANSMMQNEFQNSGIATSCPVGYRNATTGFESWWDGRVACTTSNMICFYDEESQSDNPYTCAEGCEFTSKLMMNSPSWDEFGGFPGYPLMATKETERALCISNGSTTCYLPLGSGTNWGLHATVAGDIYHAIFAQSESSDAQWAYCDGTYGGSSAAQCNTDSDCNSSGGFDVIKGNRDTIYSCVNHMCVASGMSSDRGVQSK